MTLPYRFAVLSYSSQIERLLQEFSASDEYSLDYIPLQYNKPGLGARELLRNGYDVCLVYSSYAFSVIEEVGNEIVDINKSDMDRAKALLKAGKISGKIGMPVQKRERVDIPLLEQLCNVSLHQISYDTVEELASGVRNAVAEGIKTFIGGGLVVSFCQQCHAHCVPILPDRSSMAEAVAKAMSIARLKREEQTKHEQLVAIFKLFTEGVLYINSEGNCAYANSIALNLLNISNTKEMMSDVPPEINQKISRFHDLLFVGEVLESGAPRIDQLVAVNSKELVASVVPVTIHSNNQGVAVFLRDVNSVHDYAGRVRAIQRQQSGFIAHCTVSGIKGKSPGMEQLRTSIGLYAPHDAPVLIYGETGTGKDLVAQALHNASGRGAAPFVAVNCAALPETLLESELFGYEEGAFTGARKGGKPGLFELAHTGTLFLDEMGELSQNTQLRLLRVLENKEIIRIGGSRVIPVNIRIISASHKALPDLVRAGQFRADLFYRLAVLRLQTPPLRHRLEDIPCLLETLLAQHGHDARCLTPGILGAMQQYHWPGNIRELRAVVESYLIMLGDALCDEALFLSMFAGWTRDFLSSSLDISDVELTGDLKSMLDETRRRIVQETVARCAFNKKKAARRLGISYNTLWRILGSMEESDSSGGLADPNALMTGIVDPGS